MKSKRKLVLIIIASISVVAIIFGAVVGFRYFSDNREQNKSDEQASQLACSDESFAKRMMENQLYLTEKVQELSILVEEVKTYTNYESSPNCLYALTYHSLNIGSKSELEIYYKKLSESYSQNGGYVGEIVVYGPQTPEELKVVVDFALSSPASLNKEIIVESGVIPE